MAPEQIKAAPVDRRTDVFALGAVLYELLTNHKVFGRDNELLVFKAVCEEPIAPPTTHRPDLPKELDAIVMRALAREPAERYESAAAMRRDLVVAMRALPATDLPEESLAALMQKLFPERIAKREATPTGAGEASALDTFQARDHRHGGDACRCGRGAFANGEREPRPSAVSRGSPRTGAPGRSSRGRRPSSLRSVGLPLSGGGPNSTTHALPWAPRRHPARRAGERPGGSRLVCPPFGTLRSSAPSDRPATAGSTAATAIGAGSAAVTTSTNMRPPVVARDPHASPPAAPPPQRPPPTPTASGGFHALTQRSGCVERRFVRRNGVRPQVSGVTEQVSNVREELSNATDVVSTVREEVSNATEQVPSEREQLSNATEQVPNEREQLSNAMEQVANVREMAPDGTDVVWTVREGRSNGTDLVWTVREQVWTVREEVSNEREQVWTVREEVSNEREQVWTLREHVSNEREQVSTVREQVSTATERVPRVRERLSTATNCYNFAAESVGNAN